MLRFGLPPNLVALISNVYASRKFKVIDASNESSQHVQGAGISQGYPLSPFLFVMVMSVIMYDTVADLGPADKALLSHDRLATVLYADDTLLASNPASNMKLFVVGDSSRRGHVWS